jgi:HPt (histidine-containing phosphotransfer) domain-containing protein
LEGVGDDAIFRDLVKAFLADAPKTIAQARAAVAVNDGDSVQRAFHTLKSTSATFGAMDLSEACRALEHGARQGTLPTTAQIDATEQHFIAAREILAKKL